MNQAEVIHNGRVHRDRMDVNLFDSWYFDSRDSLFLPAWLEGIKNGSFTGGCGPSAADLLVRNRNIEMEASDRLGQDIVLHGIGRKRNIGPDDSFRPNTKRSQKRVVKMANDQVLKAENLKQIMKIVDVKTVSPLKRLYFVKNAASEQSLTPTCSCSCKNYEQKWCQLPSHIVRHYKCITVQRFNSSYGEKYRRGCTAGPVHFCASWSTSRVCYF